jgi:hypothetical protein
MRDFEAGRLKVTAHGPLALLFYLQSSAYLPEQLRFFQRNFTDKALIPFIGVNPQRLHQ